MAEKQPGEAPIDAPSPAFDDAEPVGTLDLPPGWKYKRIRLFGFTLPWYASPKVQLLMVSFVCFMCPGMFNALGGMGGGGKINPTLADNMVSGKKGPVLRNSGGHYSNCRTEHCALQCFRGLRLLRRNLRQQDRCEMDSGFRRCGILHLRHQLAGVGPCLCPRLQHLCRRVARYLCRSAMDRPGHDHGLVPN
jgi:hypothetical protein